MEKVRGICSNLSSRIRICHVFFFTAFLLVVLCSIARSKYSHNEIQENLLSDSTGDCILFVGYGQAASDDLSKGGLCRFAIYGFGTTALRAAISLFIYTLKCIIAAEL